MVKINLDRGPFSFDNETTYDLKRDFGLRETATSNSFTRSRVLRIRNERCSGYQFERLFAIAHEPVSGWEVAYSVAVYQRHRVWTKSAVLRLRAMACNPNGNVDEWNLPENRVTREVSSEPVFLRSTARETDKESQREIERKIYIYKVREREREFK